MHAYHMELRPLQRLLNMCVCESVCVSVAWSMELALLEVFTIYLN